MVGKLKSFPLNSQKLQFAIILLAYIILAFILAVANRYSINPDAVSYLRLAEHISDGDFQKSVTGYWAPLTSWIMAIFLFLGFDGLTAARIFSALSGLGLILGIWLLSVRFHLSNTIRFISLLIMVLFVSYWSIRYITPDLLLAALLICYLYFVTDSSILIQKKISFLCGVLGGLAYLAKHYAFPFFVVHYPVMLILSVYSNRNGKIFSLKNTVVPLVLGMSVFLVISSPWIFLISSKYQHITISTTGRAASAIMGQKNTCEPALHPSFVGLHIPKDIDAIHTWEDPSEMDYKAWSPFESKASLSHQLKLLLNNISIIFKYFVSDSFIIGVMSLFILPFIFIQNFFNYEKKYLYSWCMVTSIIYCSGYALTFAASERYFYIIMIISLLLSFHFYEELKSYFKDIELRATSYFKKHFSVSVLIIFILTFIFVPTVRLLLFKNDYHINANKQIADKLNDIMTSGSYAIIDTDRAAYTDLYIAYYLKKQFLGRPLSTDLDGITEELKTAKANSLIVFNDLNMVQKIKNDKRYIFKAHFKSGEIQGWDSEINVFYLTKE